MRRLGLGGVTAALFLGLGVAVATTRGADKDGKPAAKGLLSDLFHEQPKEKRKQAAKAAEPKPQPLPTIETAAAKQQRLMHAWFRRVEVCDRLRMIAEQTGNALLRNQADELEERATAIYRQQTSNLPLAAQVPPAMKSLPRQAGGPAPQPRTAAPAAQPSSRNTMNYTPPSNPSRARLDGNFDQREQAILNGSSMGGN